MKTAKISSQNQEFPMRSVSNIRQSSCKIQLDTSYTLTSTVSDTKIVNSNVTHITDSSSSSDLEPYTLGSRWEGGGGQHPGLALFSVKFVEGSDCSVTVLKKRRGLGGAHQ